MKEFKELELVIPSTQGDITLKQYKKYLKVYSTWDKEDEDFIKVKMLQIFCNMKPEDVFKIPLAEYDKTILHLVDLLGEEADMQLKFTMHGKDSNGNDTEVEFGFIPKLDEMSYGEFVDLDKYYYDWQNMHKAMAVLYRPISHKKKEFYDIDPYEGTSRYCDVMDDMPLNVALGAIGFFLRLGQKLPLYTLDYLEKSLQKEEVPLQLKQTLEESGVGISQYILLLKEMLQESTKLPKQMSIPA